MQEQLAALRTLGLTEYGARAYAALVALGAAPAETIARAAPVPRTKVYSVLADLVRKEWVDVEAGRPKRFRARPPRLCFERERARVLATVDDALPVLEAQFQERSRRFGGALWILEGPEAVAERSHQMIVAARKDVFLIHAFPLPGDERTLARAIRDAAKRGVHVRVLAPDARADSARAWARAGADVREGHLPPRVLFVDGREALIAFPRFTKEGAFDVRAMWNPSPEILDLVGPPMEMLWNGASPAPM